jgi:RNA polymerase sigma factor (sigma-70 family)
LYDVVKEIKKGRDTMKTIIKRSILDYLKNPVLWIGLIIIVASMYQCLSSYLQIHYIKPNEQVTQNDVALEDADVMDGYIPTSDDKERRREWEDTIRETLMDTSQNGFGFSRQELGLSEDELTTWQSQLKVTNVVSLNEYLEQGAEPVMDARRNSHFIQPEDKIEEEELKQKLEESLEVLTEKERKVILLYYYEDLTLKEISSILEVSESRISQLHTKALLKMRKKLGNYLGILIDRE